MQTSAPLMSKTMVTLLQYRIQQEEQSSRIYLGMTMRLSDKGYSGAAKLFQKYSDEEILHANKAREMLLAHGIQPNTPALEAITTNFESFPAIIQLGYDHEVEITKQCQALTKAAFEEGNYMVAELGMRYCKEQVEELDKMQNWLDRLEAFGTEKDVLRMLDEEMGEID